MSMITQYDILKIDDPLLREALCWNDELWFDQKQLELLFPVGKSKIKRRMQTLLADANMQSHSCVFSVVKQRRHSMNDQSNDWIYQIRYYDTWFIKELQKQINCEEAAAFLTWIRQKQT